MDQPDRAKHYRALFISDIHLGTKACQAHIFLYFLKHHEAEKIYLVGDGPQLAELQRKYPGVTFTGQKEGEDLAEHYASADVFVFPSLTDTFGIVLIKAMASGLPIAAFPVTGPKDIVKNDRTGALSPDLREAALQALKLSKDACREEAMQFSWQQVAEQFLENVKKSTATVAVKPSLLHLMQ